MAGGEYRALRAREYRFAVEEGEFCPRIYTDLHEWRWFVVSASQKQHPTAVFIERGLKRLAEDCGP